MHELIDLSIVIVNYNTADYTAQCLDSLVQNPPACRYDIVVVDGDHSYEQSKKDLENALESITESGLVIVHDSFPQNVKLTGAKKQGAWCGDVYKTVMEARLQRDLSVITWDKDYGCSIISKNSLTATDKVKLDLTFENLHKSPMDSVGLVNLEQLIEYFGVFMQVTKIEETNNSELTLEEVKELYKEKFPKKKIGRKGLKTLLREINS